MHTLDRTRERDGDTIIGRPVIPSVAALQPLAPVLQPHADAVTVPRSYVRPLLSQRELEVLRCWLLSDSKSEVSAKLHVAPGTIKSHLHRIRGKYEAVGRNAGTKASLVARALQDGILKIDEL